MALLPYLMDMELQPRRLRNQLFSLDLSPDDFLTDIFERPHLRMRDYVRPWRSLAAAAKDVGSIIKSDRDKFQVNLDVQHFSPEEISVKTADGFVVIEGTHEERKDDHGFISRSFKRRYALPEDCNPDTVESKFSSDGVLTVVCPKSSGVAGERAIPVIHTGPLRRKLHEEVDREVIEEPKTPQQKRRKR